MFWFCFSEHCSPWNVQVLNYCDFIISVPNCYVYHGCSKLFCYNVDVFHCFNIDVLNWYIYHQHIKLFDKKENKASWKIKTDPKTLIILELLAKLPPFHAKTNEANLKETFVLNKMLTGCILVSSLTTPFLIFPGMFNLLFKSIWDEIHYEG